MIAGNDAGSRFHRTAPPTGFGPVGMILRKRLIMRASHIHSPQAVALAGIERRFGARACFLEIERRKSRNNRKLTYPSAGALRYAMGNEMDDSNNAANQAQTGKKPPTAAGPPPAASTVVCQFCSCLHWFEQRREGSSVQLPAFHRVLRIACARFTCDSFVDQHLWLDLRR